METYLILKPEYKDLAYLWSRFYDNCSCHISPPCSSCVHEGNPANLEETPEAWERVYSVDSDRIVSEFHMNYLLHGTRQFGKTVLQVSFAAWSVRHGLGYD